MRTAPLVIRSLPLVIKASVYNLSAISQHLLEPPPSYHAPAPPAGIGSASLLQPHSMPKLMDSYVAKNLLDSRFPPVHLDAASGPAPQGRNGQPDPAAVVAPAQSTQEGPSELFKIGEFSVKADAFTYASIILLITVLLISTSIVIIAVIMTTEGLTNVLGYYLISLSATDLILGVLVTPISIYSALLDFDDEAPIDPLFCKVEAYIEIVLWSACSFNFTWLSVDRYAALHKPSRYEIEQTLIRCRAWIIFSWTTAVLLCCPTLFGEMRSVFYQPGKICLMDWGAMKAYSITLATLVIVPSLVCIGYAYSYIFAKFREEDPDQDIRGILENDTSFKMVFFVILVFAISWIPWFGLRIYEAVMNVDYDDAVLHFSLLWLAIAGGCWKLVIYAVSWAEFRAGLKALCASVCCCCVAGRRRSAARRSTASLISPNKANNRAITANHCGKQRYL